MQKSPHKNPHLKVWSLPLVGEATFPPAARPRAATSHPSYPDLQSQTAQSPQVPVQDPQHLHHLVGRQKSIGLLGGLGGQ